VVDALDRVGRNTQAHVAAQRIRDEGHVAQVRQETPLGLDIGVAHLVAHLRALGRQFTAPRHLLEILFASRLPSTHTGGAKGSKTRPSREPRTYRDSWLGRQGFASRPMGAKACFAGRFAALRHHINGIFAADIRVPCSCSSGPGAFPILRGNGRGVVCRVFSFK
jgi:hypothetical protein